MNIFLVLDLIIIGYVLFSLLREKREPLSTLAWLFFVIALPIIGGTIYLILGPQRIENKAKSRRRMILPGKRSIFRPRLDIIQDSRTEKLFQTAALFSEQGPTNHNSLDFFESSTHALDAMIQSIEKAEAYVHLEFYILHYDQTTQPLFKALTDAARRGVKVRILYDALGSLWLKLSHLSELKKCGGELISFRPFKFVRNGWNPNFRNHRKLLVVDGGIAYTGSYNIAREYFHKRGRDTMHDYTIQLKGASVGQLEEVFERDWHYATRKKIKEPIAPVTTKEPSVVQVLDSGPDSSFALLHQTLLMALSLSQKKIALVTPYFVPDRSFMDTLAIAAYRGIQITLLLPMKSDGFLVQRASESYFDELAGLGIKIYQFAPRILHAKMLIIDDHLTMLGSANMDIRSFQLNFELNLLIYSEVFNQRAQEMFDRDLKQSTPLDVKAFSRRSLGRRLIENGCRLFSQLL